MRQILVFQFFAALLCGVPAFAGERPNIIPGHNTSDKLFFEENKNQWPSQVKYCVEIPGGNLFLEKDIFTFHLVENVDFHGEARASANPVTVQHHAYKVKFENSNPAVQVSGADKYSFVRNYYRGNDPARWAENVSVYEGVKYENMYAGIDILMYTSEKHLKYDFIVKPGADYKNIQMTYDGPEKMHIEYGHLYIKTSVGLILEQKPYAYQEINGTKKEVSCKYVLEENKLSFAVKGNYNKSLPLIIDPTLIAATYTGSSADNWGFTATYDFAGNIYTGGVALAAGYPATAGAFQMTFGGGSTFSGAGFPFDITLSKLNPTGTALLFSTYYGGSNNEQPHSLFVNGNNELYVVGRTYSTNFPTTAGSYDQSHNGGADIIVGKFNSTGGIMASTFVGGSGDDCVNVNAASNSYGSIKYNYADDGRSEIILDAASNVYVAACTKSANFPTTAGAYDATLGGAQDGCVFKMNSALSGLIFSTYLGGSADDAAYGLKVDNGGDVYVTGGTTSNNFPTTAGVLHPAYMGGLADGFISKLNSTGTALLSSTFIGTAAYDQSYFIEYDAGNNIYVFGQTAGAYPVAGGVYSNANSSQFIHKMDATLSTTIFSTVVGSGSPNPNISPTAFLVDSCQSIYIAGWGRCAGLSSSTPNANTVFGMPITANAQQSTTDGCDFYFMVLTPDAKALWYGTFYGENGGTPDHVDGGTSRFDRRAFIYQSVCASCGSTNAFPTLPGAYSTNNNSANCNNALIKMDVSVHPVAKANLTGPTIGCSPFTVPFNTTGSVASDYIWNFGDGSPSDTVKNTSHTYTTVGTFTVTLYAMDSLGVCVYLDSSKLVITVGNPPDLFITPVHNLCFGDSTGTASVSANGGFNPYSYLWTNTQTTITATGLSAGAYTVAVTDSVGCLSTETITITEPIPIVGVIINSTNVNCKGGNDGSATASASGGTGTITYTWSTNPVQAGPLATNLSAGIYTVTINDANACTVTDTITITEPPGMILTSIITPCGCGVTNGMADVSASGGLAPYTYLWLTSPVQTSSLATGLGVGPHSVVITDSKGCLEVQSVNVNGVAPPQADFYYTPEFVSYLDPVVSFYDASSDNPYYWSWNFGDAPSGAFDSSAVQNPEHTYNDTGSYCITLIVYDSTRVCVDTTIKCLKIEPEFTFYIPNAFTPNGNGLNEIFYGYGTYIKEFEIMIFDRWGNLIFESNDILKGWDGKVQRGKSGDMVQEDVYVWKVKIIDVRDNVHKYIGHVSTVK